MPRVITIAAAAALAACAGGRSEPAANTTTTTSSSTTTSTTSSAIVLSEPGASGALGASPADLASATPSSVPPEAVQSPPPPAGPGAPSAPSPAAETTALSPADRILREQVLLDRAHYSPGEIDGRGGTNTRLARAAFARDHGAAPAEAAWSALSRDSAPTLVTYTNTADDVAGPFTPIPEDMMEKAKLPRLGYSSALEGLGEKFHAKPQLLKTIGKTQSHGCIRLTNWDALELADMVGPGTPAILQE